MPNVLSLRFSAFLFIAASFALAGNIASAQDAPARDPQTATWTGIYGGEFAGANILASRALGFGGLRAGYNRQFDNLVIGFQADAVWRPESATGATDWSEGGIRELWNYRAVHSLTANFLSTLTARAGYEVGDRVLPFISGGLILGPIDMATTVSGSGALRGGGLDGGGGFHGGGGLGGGGGFHGEQAITTNAYGANSLDLTRAGWTLGGGVEYALFPGWSLDLQYQYYRFSQTTPLVTVVYASGQPITKFTFWNNGAGNLISLGLNFHI